MYRMLIVERDPAFAHAWQTHFMTEGGFHVDVVDCDLIAKQQLHDHTYDVIIVSSALPQVDAIGFCQSYRSSGGSTPILLTADKQSTVQLENGLDAGADNILVKPVKLSDLNACIRALLRRPPALSSEIIEIKQLVLDIGQGTVFVGGQELHLHPMELNLLEFLLKNQNHIFDREALLERVWQDRSNASIGSVRTHIKTLRRKLEERNVGPIIKTVRGRGYKLVSE